MDEVILKQINEIDLKLIVIDKQIINETYDTLNNVKFYNIKKDFLSIKTNLLTYDINNNHIPQELHNKIESISNNIKLIEDYINLDNSEKINKSINYLTLINTILFPVSIITGYFGMNFENFGYESIKHPHILIFSLTFLSVVVNIFIVYKIKY